MDFSMCNGMDGSDDVNNSCFNGIQDILKVLGLRFASVGSSPLFFLLYSL